MAGLGADFVIYCGNSLSLSRSVSLLHHVFVSLYRDISHSMWELNIKHFDSYAQTN